MNYLLNVRYAGLTLDRYVLNRWLRGHRRFLRRHPVGRIALLVVRFGGTVLLLDVLLGRRELLAAAHD